MIEDRIEELSDDDKIRLYREALEYEESGMDAEEALHTMGLEPDFVYDFMDIIARA